MPFCVVIFNSYYAFVKIFITKLGEVSQKYDEKCDIEQLMNFMWELFLCTYSNAF